MPLVVTTSIINKKTYLMTFIVWAIILTDVIFGTFLDVLGKPLNSSFGVILFIAMSITVFFAGLYALRDYMAALRKELETPSFFNRLYKATPIFLYALLVIFGAIIVEMVLFSQYSTYLLILIVLISAVAILFFGYFKDQIGRATFWTLIILPPVLFLTGIFVPQLLTTGSQFVYMEPRFLIFRVIGTAGWVAADFVIAYAYLLVAKTLGRQITSSSHNKILNYLIIAALSTILVSPTTNNWITNNSYPPFGAIQRAFLVLASFLFSTGIYSVALSLAQDAKLRHLARKYAREYALLDTLGIAQLDAEIRRKYLKLIDEHAGAMKKETGIEPLTDDNEIRQYLDLVIRETREKKDDRTVGA